MDQGQGEHCLWCFISFYCIHHVFLLLVLYVKQFTHTTLCLLVYIQYLGKKIKTYFCQYHSILVLFLCKDKNIIQKYLTTDYYTYVVSNTEHANTTSLLTRNSYQCFPSTVVFCLEHITVHLVLRNVSSYNGVCVSFEHRIPF